MMFFQASKEPADTNPVAQNGTTALHNVNRRVIGIRQRSGRINLVATRWNSNSGRVKLERNRWIYDLIYCGDCGCHVPVFHDLAPPQQAQVGKWAPEHKRYGVIAEETGLSKGQAKSWLHHHGRPIRRKGRWNSTPCPHCGRWLRSAKAQQCFHCSAEWHGRSAGSQDDSAGPSLI
jgi:hypothetical protein